MFLPGVVPPADGGEDERLWMLVRRDRVLLREGDAVAAGTDSSMSARSAAHP